MSKPRINLVGQTFGRLTILRQTPYQDPKTKSRGTAWIASCACDPEREVTVYTGLLRSGNTKSCGCGRSEFQVTHGATRGGVKQPLYQILSDMRQRCYNENHPCYTDYGGRGIDIYDEWIHNYPVFSAYVLALPDCPKDAQIPGAHLERSLDRIRNNEGYKPGNVRWATQKEQMNNTRVNRTYNVIQKDGTRVRMTLKQIVDKYGKASYPVVCNRINRGKWPLKKAVLTPTET